MYSFGYFHGVWFLYADVSEHSICSIFIGWISSYPAYEDGTDRVFRNVGIQQPDAAEIPKRIHTRFKTRRKLEIKIIKNYCIEICYCLTPTGVS